MTIVCYVCKKEVEVMRFGNGFVGICCNKVMYNSMDRTPFDIRRNKKKEISMHPFHPERPFYKANNS